MLRFLVDESSGRKLSKALTDGGHDAVFVGNIMLGSKDEQVLEKAVQENRILITNDKDFGELIFRQGKPSTGLILLRLRSDSPKSRILYTNILIRRFGDDLTGSFVILTEKKIRMRRLKKQL